MSEITEKKYLNYSGLQVLINKVKTYISNKLGLYYTKTEIDSMEFITVDEIDVICSSSVE